MPDDRSPSGGGVREERKAATAMALRNAAISLMVEHGYDATSTDDIARAAGVSPRTFFNYFPTKESVVVLPDAALADLLARELRRRPLDEDPRESLAAVASSTVDGLAALAPSQDGSAGSATPLAVARLMFSERPLRQIFFERRAVAEETAWSVLVERGADPADLELRVAATTIVALTYLGLRLWVEGDGAEPLAEVVARCLGSVVDRP